MTIVHYQRGQLIFAEDEPADSAFYVGTGKVKITMHSPAGKEALLTILEPGEFLGETCLTRLKVRVATATALTDCTLMRISIAAIRRALRDDPKFSERFLTYMLERGRRIHEMLADQLVNSAEQRLARTLLRLANFGSDGIGEPVVTDISHEMLAGMVGTTRSHITRFMSDFRRRGFVSYDRKGLRIHNALMHFVLHD